MTRFPLSPTCILALGLALAPAALAATPPDPQVKAHLQAQDLKFEVDPDGDYKLTIGLANGRTQLVWVRSATAGYASVKVREIWSPGLRLAEGEIPAQVANRLLRHSHEVILGGWTKQKAYAMFVVKIPAGASAQQLRDAVQAAADAADEIEKELTPGSDEL